MQEILIVLICTAVAFALAWWLRGNAAKAHLAKLQVALESERSKAELFAGTAARLPDMEERARTAEVALQKANDVALTSEKASVAALTQRDSVIQDRDLKQLSLAEALGKLESVQKELAVGGTALATAVAQRDAANALGESTARWLSDAKEQLKDAFLVASSGVFDEKAKALDVQIKELSGNSKKDIEDVLKPFSTQVADFKSKVEQLALTDATTRSELVGKIDEMRQQNQDMADATRAMTSALKGSSKARGNWGELILETTLKASGLIEGIHFFPQDPTKNEDSGRTVFPDVIVKLPDKRQIVIDSKVSLVAWTEAVNASTPEAEQEALLRHTASIRQHMRDLSEKNYPRIIGAEALELTVLFVPIEGALSAALSINPDLQEEALRKRIAFTSPNTLCGLLKVVDRAWSRERVTKSIDEINKTATLLLESVFGFYKHLEQIGIHIGQARASFDQAKNQLQESDRSVQARTQRLISITGKGNMKLPKGFVDEESVPLALPFAQNTAPASDEPA